VTILRGQSSSILKRLEADLSKSSDPEPPKIKSLIAGRKNEAKRGIHADFKREVGKLWMRKVRDHETTLVREALPNYETIGVDEVVPGPIFARARKLFPIVPMDSRVPPKMPKQACKSGSAVRPRADWMVLVQSHFKSSKKSGKGKKALSKSFFLEKFHCDLAFTKKASVPAEFEAPLAEAGVSKSDRGTIVGACSLCADYGSNPESLMRHMRLAHYRVVFTCTRCDLTEINPDYLANTTCVESLTTEKWCLKYRFCQDDFGEYPVEFLINMGVPVELPPRAESEASSSSDEE
jgi:hypothetical protein